MTIAADIRDLFTFRDSPVRWPIAIQAALAMALPIAIFTVAGRPQLGLIACTGGFLALYLSNRSRRERALLLPLVGVGLIASAAIGAAVSWSTPLSLVALFLVAVIASVILLGFGAGPPGGLFFMLVTGVSVRLTAPTTLDGVGLAPGLVIGMLAVGSAIAYLIVMAPLAVRRVRARDFEAHANRMRLRFSVAGDTRVILVRLVIACALAVAVSAPLGVHRTYWVLLTVIAILQNGRRLRLTALRGIHRVLGTLVGLALFALILQLRPAGLWLAVLLGALQFVVELVVIRNYGLALIFITPLALIIAAQGDPGDIGTITLIRVEDTVLGAGVALVVLLGALVLRRFLPGVNRRIAG